jgi:hypothetical protein
LGEEKREEAQSVRTLLEVGVELKDEEERKRLSSRTIDYIRRAF